MRIRARQLRALLDRELTYRIGLAIGGGLLVAAATVVPFSYGVDAQEEQDVDPVYITTLPAPEDGSQQAIVMPESVTISGSEPWFGPFYTLNEPDRSVDIDVLHQDGFLTTSENYMNSGIDLCGYPGLLGRSFTMVYQRAAEEGFYVRRCPVYSHLTTIRLSVITYPKGEVYTTHYFKVISDDDPATATTTPTASPTLTPTQASTPTATPDPLSLAPSNLNVSLNGNGQVALTWDAPSSDSESVDGYQVLRRRPKAGESQLEPLVVNTGNSNTHYVDLTANEPSVKYTYRVKAVRNGVLSQWSNYDNVTLAGATHTPTPTLIPSPSATATPTPSPTTTVTPTPTLTPTPTHTLTPSPTATATLTPTPTPTQTLTPTATATSAPSSDPPAAPGRPFGQLTDLGEVSLDWSDVSGARSYDVSLWLGADWATLLPDRRVNGVSIVFGGSSASVSGLPTDYDWYFFSVRARNATGSSGWSPYNQVWARVLPERPERPAGQSTGPGEVSLDWNDAAFAETYDVLFWMEDRWVELPTDSVVRGISIVFDGSSAVVSGLPTDYDTYFFQVRSRNSIGVSQWSPNNQNDPA